MVYRRKKLIRKWRMQREFLKPCCKVPNAKKNVKAEFSGMALSGTALTHCFCQLITSDYSWWLEYFKWRDSPANSGERKGTTLKEKPNCEDSWAVDAKQHRLDEAKQMNAQKAEVCLSRDGWDAYRGSRAWTRVLSLEMLYTITYSSFSNREARQAREKKTPCPSLPSKW